MSCWEPEGEPHGKLMHFVKGSELVFFFSIRTLDRINVPNGGVLWGSEVLRCD